MNFLLLTIVRLLVFYHVVDAILIDVLFKQEELLFGTSNV
jgi:hypothetical protein